MTIKGGETDTLDCPCLTARCSSLDNSLKELTVIRESCPAIKEILIPDSTWPDFQRLAYKEQDAANHRHILLLAFERGHLSKITSPVHRYLIENDKPKGQLVPQYKQDLKELWMLKENELERHRTARMYMGKLTELLCAEWIEQQGWNISNLAPLGGEADIEAVSPDNIKYSFEVKYIGEEDEKFLKRMRENGGTFDPYNDSDYLLYIAYTGAKQILSCNYENSVIVIISNLSWPFMQIPLKDGWIKWNLPEFFDGNRRFIDKERYPDIQADLGITLGKLKELWIVKQENDFEYAKQYIINFE